MSLNSPGSVPEEKKRGVPLGAQITIWVLLVGFLAIVALRLQRSEQGHIAVGQGAPDFALSLYSGYEYNGQSEVKLSDLRGKVVLINFWASWCKPCEQEAPFLETTWKFYEPMGKVIFLGVDWVDTEPDARIYMKKFGNTYPNGPDVGTRISQAFRTTGVPETYIIDANGILRYVKIGPFASIDEIKAIIDPLLQE